MNQFQEQPSFQQQQFWESQYDLPGLRQLLAVAVDANAAASPVAPATSFQSGLYAQYGLPQQQQPPQAYVAPNTWPGSLQPMPLSAPSMPVHPYHTTPSPSGSSGGSPSPISPSLSMGSSASPYSASPTTPLSAHLHPAAYASSSTSSYGPATFAAPTPLPTSAIPTASSLQLASSSGPAKGQFAVLTLSGRTLASSGNYKEVLSAARSAKRGAGANGEGIPDETRTCGFCGKVCDRPSTLKTHMNSHTGQRPHLCYVPGCGRQFTVLSNMYRHAKQCAVQHGHVRDEGVGARGGGASKPTTKRRPGSAGSASRSEDGDEDAEDSS